MDELYEGEAPAGQGFVSRPIFKLFPVGFP